ncbi:sensor domain-containing diguanylate cyclase [Alkalicoccus urumqiensis]|nr:sensor domain-containing diguanylate cyclase [Alkalicoccus urumqiensis]
MWTAAVSIFVILCGGAALFLFPGRLAGWMFTAAVMTASVFGMVLEGADASGPAFTAAVAAAAVFLNLISLSAVVLGVSVLFLYFGQPIAWIAAVTGAAFFIYTGAWMIRSREKKETDWMDFYHHQSKNLHVLREISLVMQSTLEPTRLSHIFLTSLTAGYGLGYNRAMLFIHKGNGEFYGKAAIGPLTAEQGYDVWENVAVQKWTLRDFILQQKEAESNDSELNSLLQTMHFSNKDSSILYQMVADREPLLLHPSSLEAQDQLSGWMASFSISEAAVLPLTANDKIIGFAAVDNIVDNRPITYEDLDQLMPLVNQAAMAMENAYLYEMTKSMAWKDGLTGLYNKRYLEQQLAHVVDSFSRNNKEVSVLLLDIDYFKQFNDTNGHLLGDEVLKALAEVLQNLSGESGSACRFGGEEFVLLLPGASLEEAGQTAEQIMEDVKKIETAGAASQPFGHISVSIGGAELRRGMTAEALLHEADQAAYEAKRNGRNQMVLHEREMYV